MKREVLGISGKMEQELGIYDLQSANNWLSKQKWPAYSGKYEFREKDGQFEFVEQIELVVEQSPDLEVVVDSAKKYLEMDLNLFRLFHESGLPVALNKYDYLK